jgi:divalent metal cation (Fe/Co/Zn/Cd) transporter
MKMKIINVISGIIIFSVFFLIVYTFYEAVGLIYKNFSSIDVSVLIAIIGGTISLSSFFITRYLERKKTSN